MSRSKLQAYVEELRRPPELPSFEPDIDDLDAEQDRKMRCCAATQSAVIEQMLCLGLPRASTGVAHL